MVYKTMTIKTKAHHTICGRHKPK